MNESCPRCQNKSELIQGEVHLKPPKFEPIEGDPWAVQITEEPSLAPYVKNVEGRKYLLHECPSCGLLFWVREKGEES